MSVFVFLTICRLSLSNNDLSSRWLQDDVFSHLHNLKHLEISSNRWQSQQHNQWEPRNDQFLDHKVFNLASKVIHTGRHPFKHYSYAYLSKYTGWLPWAAWFPVFLPWPACRLPSSDTYNKNDKCDDDDHEDDDVIKMTIMMIMILAMQAANNQINKISDLPDLHELV